MADIAENAYIFQNPADFGGPLDLRTGTAHALPFVLASSSRTTVGWGGEDVVEIQERVATLEGRVVEHARLLTDIAGAIRHLEARMDQRFTSVDLRFTALESRLTAIDQKLDRTAEALDQKIGAVGSKLEREVGRLDQKLDSHFRWIVGIQFAILIALVASFIAG